MFRRDRRRKRTIPLPLGLATYRTLTDSFSGLKGRGRNAGLASWWHKQPTGKFPARRRSESRAPGSEDSEVSCLFPAQRTLYIPLHIANQLAEETAIRSWPRGRWRVPRQVRIFLFTLPFFFSHDAPSLVMPTASIHSHRPDGDIP
jgi:hypothetical protein